MLTQHLTLGDDGLLVLPDMLLRAAGLSTGAPVVVECDEVSLLVRPLDPFEPTAGPQ